MFEYLRETMLSRGWNLARLAEACDVDISLASKWVSETERKRVVPGPRSCEKIADALGVDLDYVLELAGHRPPREEALALSRDPRLAGVNSRWDRLPEVLKSVVFEIVTGHSNGTVTQPYALPTAA